MPPASAFKVGHAGKMVNDMSGDTVSSVLQVWPFSRPWNAIASMM